MSSHHHLHQGPATAPPTPAASEYKQALEAAKKMTVLLDKELEPKFADKEDDDEEEHGGLGNRTTVRTARQRDARKKATNADESNAADGNNKLQVQKRTAVQSSYALACTGSHEENSMNASVETVSPKMRHTVQTHWLPNRQDGPEMHSGPMITNSVNRWRDTNKVNGIRTVSGQHISGAHRRTTRTHPNYGYGTCKSPATGRRSGQLHRPQPHMHLTSTQLDHVPDPIHATTRGVDRSLKHPRHIALEKWQSRRRVRTTTAHRIQTNREWLCSKKQGQRPCTIYSALPHPVSPAGYAAEIMAHGVRRGQHWRAGCSRNDRQDHHNAHGGNHIFRSHHHSRDLSPRPYRQPLYPHKPDTAMLYAMLVGVDRAGSHHTGHTCPDLNYSRGNNRGKEDGGHPTMLKTLMTYWGGLKPGRMEGQKGDGGRKRASMTTSWKTMFTVPTIGGRATASIPHTTLNTSPNQPTERVTRDADLHLECARAYAG